MPGGQVLNHEPARQSLACEAHTLWTLTWCLAGFGREETVLRCKFASGVRDVKKGPSGFSQGCFVTAARLCGSARNRVSCIADCLAWLAGCLPRNERASTQTMAAHHRCGGLAGWQPGICAGKPRSPSCFPAALPASTEMSRQDALEGSGVFSLPLAGQRGSRAAELRASVGHHRMARWPDGRELPASSWVLATNVVCRLPSRLDEDRFHCQSSSSQYGTASKSVGDGAR